MMARPTITPTDEQRRIVKSMAGMGIPHEQIVQIIGYRSPKTLRKHFRKELDVGAAEANYKVATTLFRMATSGECVAATIFWAKTRNGLREYPQAAQTRPSPPPFIVARELEGGQQ
jgi:hypothetical protein